MKKNSYALVLLLVVVSGLVFANRKTKNDNTPSPKPLSIAAREARMVEDRKKWEASADGIKYKTWEASSAGKKVHASHDRIRKKLDGLASMQAVVTSLTFHRANESASAPKWLIVKINGEPYMMQFTSKDFERLKSLKVNDNIIIKSRNAGYSPNHPYLIISGDYIEKDGKVLFKRDFNKNNRC